MPGAVLGVENMHSYKHMDKWFCLIPGITAAMETEVFVPRWREERPPKDPRQAIGHSENQPAQPGALTPDLAVPPALEVFPGQTKDPFNFWVPCTALCVSLEGVSYLVGGTFVGEL